MSKEMLRNQLNADLARFEGAGMTEQAEKVRARLDGLDDEFPDEQADDAEVAEVGEEDPWASVNITPAARARADELGLTAENFKRRRASGKSGFVVGDVDRIAEAMGKGETEDSDGNE